jgi:RNA polymerase sporulation-specific sigma factor
MSKYPEHIRQNITTHGASFYSLYEMDNIHKCKNDSSYMGEAMLANEHLIWHSVHKYVGKPEIIVATYRVEKDDILQLGRLGFYKAMMAFDTERGVKFSSFAVTAIVREIKCYLRDSANIIRPTRTANELINRISRLEAELGYQPSIADVAIILDEPEERVKKALQIGKTVKYLDEPISKDISNGYGENYLTSLDLVPDAMDIERDVLDKLLIDSVIQSIQDKLTSREVEVLKDRINGYNQTQSAERCNMSQMRVNRIMKKVAYLLQDIDKIIKGA